MDDGRTVLLILLLCDPQLVERTQTGQNAASNPRGIFTFEWDSRRMYLDLLLHCQCLTRNYAYTGHQTGKLEIESFGQASRQGSVADHDDVLEKRCSNVNVACHNGIMNELRQRNEVFETMGVWTCLDGSQGRWGCDVLKSGIIQSP